MNPGAGPQRHPSGHAVAWLRSPLGRLRLESDGQALTALHFDYVPTPIHSTADAVIEQATRQLREYFDGHRRQFELTLNPTGTPFQQRVWQELLAIPFGSTVSYGEIARRLGEPGAARAVGLANNRNPIALIIPCHRVIGASGDLVGYGGGLAAKTWLLQHEGALLPEQRQLF